MGLHFYFICWHLNANGENFQAKIPDDETEHNFVYTSKTRTEPNCVATSEMQPKQNQRGLRNEMIQETVVPKPWITPGFCRPIWHNSGFAQSVNDTMACDCWKTLKKLVFVLIKKQAFAVWTSCLIIGLRCCWEEYSAVVQTKDLIVCLSSWRTKRRQKVSNSHELYWKN